MFTPDTEWSADDPWVPVQLEHGGGLLGVGRIIETDDGMSSKATSSPPDRGPRRLPELSPGLVDLITVRRANGVLEAVDATLDRGQPGPPWPLGLVHEGRPRPRRLRPDSLTTAERPTGAQVDSTATR